MLKRTTSINARYRSVVRAAAMTAMLALGGYAGASEFNYVVDTSPNWNTASNWTRISGTGTFPNAAGDIANVTRNITQTNTITFNVAVTLGILNLGDTNATNRFALTGPGPLTFNNGASNAQLNIVSTSAGDTIGTVPILLNSSLDLTQNSARDFTLTSTLSGAGALTKLGAGKVILTGATNNNNYSGGTTIAAGALQGNNLSLQSSIANSATLIFDQGADATHAVTITGAGTLVKGGVGALTLSNALQTTGDVVVSQGTLATPLSSDTPFGTGSILLDQRGTLAITPSGSTTATVSAATGAGRTFSFAGGNNLSLNRGANTAVTLTAGGNTDGTTLNFVRSGRGTLMLSPAAGIAELGVSEKFIVNGTGGNVPAVVNGMTAPYIVARASPADTQGDFLTYGAADGFTSAAPSYASMTGTAIAPAAGSILYVPTGTNTVTTTGTPHAIKVGNNAAAVTLNLNAGVTLGTGSAPAGLILNTATIGGSSTLGFQNREAVVYTSSGNGTINAPIAGTGGLTKFGSGALTLGGNNALSGGVHLNEGNLTLTNVNALGNTPALQQANGLVLHGPATLTFSGDTFNDASLANSMEFHGGGTGDAAVNRIIITRSGTTSSGSAANIRRPDNPLTLSGTLSSGTLSSNVYGAGGVHFRVGAYKLTADNSGFDGEMSLGTGSSAQGAIVILAHNNAIGSATISTSYSTIGVSDGVTISNVTYGMSALKHDQGHSQFMGYGVGGTWTGRVNLAGTASALSSEIGAESGATLSITGVMNSLEAGFIKTGLGTVEITGTNTYGSRGSGNAASTTSIRTQVLAGTLLVNNASGSGTGRTLVHVESGATLGGNGTISGGVRIKDGATLAPGNSFGTLTLIGGGVNVTGAAAANYAAPGNLTVDSTAVIATEFGTAGHDLVALTLSGATANIAGSIQYSTPGGFNPTADGFYDFIIADNISYQGVTSGALNPQIDNLQAALTAAGYTQSFTYSIVQVGPTDYPAGQYANLDAIRLQFVVPEPGTVGLAAAATFGMLATRRRRARRVVSPA